MQNYLEDSVTEMMNARKVDMLKPESWKNWRKLDMARVLEMMVDYYFDNYCVNEEAPIFLTEENTGLGLEGIRCSRCWELFC